jgi:ABC-type multidrug transport system fused ATPase/permease subunit
VNEKVASVAVVQAFGQADRERARVEEQSRRLQRAMIKRARHLGRLTAITEATTAAGTAVVLLVGAVSGLRAGTVAAATLIVGLLVPQLRDLGRAEEYWHNFTIARGKITEVLARPTGVPEVPDALTLVPGPGRLQFAGVTVEGSLQTVDAVAEAGRTVAVVGSNGSGKSTLLSLAARLLDPDRGRVLLDDQDLARHTLVSVHRVVGLAGPDLPLLRGTVEHNLRYRWPDAPDEELARVSALCDLDALIAGLPKGVETRIAERGVGLSAGERQRIALARALVGSPPLLLLDEADANLDAHAAEVVDRVVRGYSGTVLIVTHRADLLSAADMIWYLEDGRLVESGPPAELLASGGPTARLFQAEAIP